MTLTAPAVLLAGTQHVDVLVVGAGISGIGAAYHLREQFPERSFLVLDALESHGGTWWTHRYPGVRSDSDLFTFGYRFKPWRGPSIATSTEILSYLDEVIEENDLGGRIRYGHRVTAASWSSEDQRWTVEVTRAEDGEQLRLTTDFLWMCQGYYNHTRPYQPQWPGMDRFRGEIVHPQQWPTDLDLAGRRVVVIGSGATAITLVPALAETAAHVTMLQRSPSYIASMPAASPATRLRRLMPSRWAGTVVRWLLALLTQASYQLSRRRPALMKKLLRTGVERALPAGFDIDTHFTPTYDPWDQRMCVVPDGDLFKAISSGAASVVTDHIDTFTAGGVRLQSGAELDADVIVTATGLELLFLGGIALEVDGEAIDANARLTYKGMMLEGVPNLAFAFGYTNASWTLKAELTCDYVTRLLNRLHTKGLRQCTPINSDPAVTAAPFIGLTSGYVQRGSHLFPQQGTAFPWQVHQSYLRDFRAMRMKGIDDDAMRFSNPARELAAS